MTELYANDHNNIYPRHFNRGDDPSFDVEAARRELELLLSSSDGVLENPSRKMSISSSTSSQDIPSTHSHFPQAQRPKLEAISTSTGSFYDGNPLTTIGRERLIAERSWISRLSLVHDVDNIDAIDNQDKDAALSDLQHLWSSERGSKAAQSLELATELVTSSQPCDWDRAEGILRSLIADHGPTFGEPWHLLATLFVLQGRYVEALPLYQTLLHHKPWHVGALSGIVRAYEGLGDVQRAREWAAFRLPKASHINRRQQWVERALQDIDSKLQEAEQANLEAFGRVDAHVDVIEDREFPLEDDAWQ